MTHDLTIQLVTVILLITYITTKTTTSGWNGHHLTQSIDLSDSSFI